MKELDQAIYDICQQAHALCERGHVHEAYPLLEEGLKKLKSYGSQGVEPRLKILLFNGLGHVFECVNRHEEAKEWYERSLEIAEQEIKSIQDDRDDHKKDMQSTKRAVETNLARLYAKSEEYEKAIVYFRKLILEDDKARDHDLSADHRARLADALMYLGNLDEALMEVDEALKIAERYSLNEVKKLAWGVRDDILSNKGVVPNDPQTEKRYLEAIQEAGNNLIERARAEYSYAKWFVKLLESGVYGREEEARPHFLNFIACIDQARPQLSSQAFRTAFNQRFDFDRKFKEALFYLYVHGQCRGHSKANDVFYATEIYRRHSLMNIVDVDDLSQIDLQNCDALRQIHLAYCRKVGGALQTDSSSSRKMSRKVVPVKKSVLLDDPTGMVEKESPALFSYDGADEKRLFRDFQNQWEKLLLNRSAMTAQNKLKVRHLEEIRPFVDEKALIIEYADLDGILGIFALDSHEPTMELVKEVHLKRIDGYVNLLRDEMQKAEDKYEEGVLPGITSLLETILKDLYGILIKPVESKLSGKDTVVVIPFGTLWKLPFAALHDGRQYLIERCAVLSELSVSGLVSRRKPGRWGGKLLMLADPTLDLPGTEDEADAVEKSYQGESLILRQSQATKSKFLEELEDARIMHMACHGFFNEQAPLLSYLLLSPKEEDNFLCLYEWALSNMDAELVILSACQSGLSEVASGDEQVGFTRALLAAGAGGVLSTLWCMADEACNSIMANFYQNWHSINTAQALRKAQLELLHRKKFQHPFFWSGWYLIGQWRTVLGDSNVV